MKTLSVSRGHEWAPTYPMVREKAPGVGYTARSLEASCGTGIRQDGLAPRVGGLSGTIPGHVTREKYLASAKANRHMRARRLRLRRLAV